jgi:hypothetical protein
MICIPQHLGDRIKGDEIGESCGTYGGGEF